MPDNVETVTIEAPRIERKPRNGAEARPVEEKPVDERPKGPTPEEALAQSTDIIRSKDAEIEAQRAKAREAEERAERAQGELVSAAAGRVSDQEARINSDIEAAKQAQSTAKLARRSAREAGDADAEDDAIEQLTQATYRLERANDAKRWLDGEKERIKTQPSPEQRPQSGPSEAAKKWLDEHPRFDVDPEYNAAAVTAHNAAVARGIPNGSQQYIEFIESRLLQRFGENHGAIKPMTQQREAEPRRSATSTAAPTSRGSGSGSGGGREVRTLLGAVTVTGQGDDVRISIPKDIMPQFEEGAQISGMSIAAYALDQVRIAEERLAGGTGGLQMSDQVYG